MLRRALFAVTVLAASCLPSLASQNTLTTPGAPLTMAQLATFLNNAHDTIATNYSGATAPAVCTASTACTYQYWLDTSSSPRVLRINDGTSWVSIGSLDATAHTFTSPASQTPSTTTGTTFTATDGDKGSLRRFTNSGAVGVTQPQPSSSIFTSGWYIDYRNAGTGTVTITPTVATIDGASSLTLPPGRSVRIVSDGTNYFSNETVGTPTTAVLGGVFSLAAVSSNWLRSLGTDGIFTASQPAASDLSNGVTGSGAVVLATGPSISAPTIAGGTHTAITSLGIRSTGAAFDLTLASTEVFTAGRTLTITLNDVARTLNLGGNLTTAGALTHAGAFATTITATNTTNSTLPAGTHTLAGLDVAQTWSALQGFNDGDFGLNGSSSGQTIVKAPSTGGGTATFFAGSDTVVGKATNDTLTNKTYDTAGTGNSFSINGLAATANTGTGSVVRATGPTISAPTITGTLATANQTITSTSANALAVGPAGATNPTLQIDASTATAATGLKVKSAAAAGGLALSVITSGTNENLTLDAAGSGTINIGSVSTGAITLTRATTISAALTYGGVTLSNAVTGTGNMVLSAGPTFTGTLTASVGSFSSTLASTAHTITSASANALAVGLNGATNPALQVDASTASSATGIKIKSAAAAAGVAISVITSGTNENLTIDAAGSGTITLGGTSTGAITMTRATTLSAALTYGGVALSNSVTGTGSMVLSAGPTITGHPTIEGVTSTGATGTGNFVFDGSPTLVTPNIGVATATSVNKVAITAPLTSATLTIANGKTFTASNTITLTAAADSQSFAFPATGDTIVTLGATQTLTAKSLTAPITTGLVDVRGAIKYSTQSAPAQIAANQNNYNPSSVVCATSTTLLINSDAARDITGMAGGVIGCEMVLINNGSFTITLKEENGSSTAANQFKTGGDIALTSSGAVTLRYDNTASRWRMVSLASSGGGAGTVTSVATTYPICGGTITTSGTLTYCGPTWAGYLSYTSTTAVDFKPYNGDTLRIAGTVYQIPIAGIAGCTTTSAFVNGTGASSLGASTLYYVYAFVNSGTVTCDFRTDGNGHLPDSTAGNIGTEVRVSSGTTRDNTRSLIGMAYTDGSSHFVDAQVASWYNQRPKMVLATGSTTGTATASRYVTWASTAVTIASSGNLNNTTTQSQSCQLHSDGAQVGSGSGNTISGQVNNYPYGLTYTNTFTEGTHTTGTVAVANTGTTTCTYVQSAQFAG